jgi:hemoglobin
MNRDIITKEDIKMMVDKFYDKVNKDELLGPVFNSEAEVNWEEHLPKMYAFWGTQLIGTQDYTGRPFPPHTELKITPKHFERWLKLFIQNIEENFSGPTADLAVYKAKNIASVFQYKLGLIKKD